MKTSDFNYNLPKNLIAQKPASPRDHSRLMVLSKSKKTIEHKSFFDLPDYLEKGDVLVFNNSKVFKARLFGKLNQEAELPMGSSASSSKPVEIFLIKQKDEFWQVLAKPSKKLKKGNKIYFSKDFFATSFGHHDEQTFLVKFNLSGKKFWQAIEKFGHIPIPPYIKEEPDKFEKYQTIYAKKIGSVAAPTAGLHFTNRMMKKLEKKGVQIEYITLHVGLGTFLPVKVDNVTKHHMHSELAFVDKITANRINKAKKESRRIIAVGTTSARVLESAVKNGLVIEYNNDTDIFIYPPYRFKILDSVITNFHLPDSTLLMMISAFAQNKKDKSIFGGRNFILKAYKEAIKKKYRFFSFGDAMFISE